MKQILLKKGNIYTADVARPLVEDGMVLIRTAYSCISAGTEMSGVESSGSSLVKLAIEHPEYVPMGLNMLKERGIKDTWDTIQGKYELGSPMGYSASGYVVASGSKDFKPGDAVACMGAGYANHAGYVCVPQNLVVKVPDGVSMEHAATAALGCIAMQGVRRAEVKLGEFVVITGMGILGQLACRFAVASGANVIVTDIDERRLEIAKNNGAMYALQATTDVVKAVNDITGGHGADSVIITAATRSNDLISQAFKMCRRKGKVVLVGVAGMDLKREDMYRKELDFVISTSYGPGRYDSNYEEKGMDYPYGYVRFTEQRNLESYLRLMQAGRIDISDIIEGVYPAEDADRAYAALKSDSNRPLVLLIEYNEEESKEAEDTTVPNPNGYQIKNDRIRVALCGVGGFAKGMHIPNLKRLSDKYEIYAVQSRTGANAQAVAIANNAKYSTTDYQQILADPDVDMVMICTRHNLHAQMVVDAMKAGKAVFVEKPMATTNEEMQQVVATAKETGVPFMVGFNRRFSKYAVEVKKAIKDRKNPMIINYTMNAGYIPLDHWTQTEEGAGRIIGEGCHIFDLFNFFTDSKAESVSVNKISPKTDHVSSSDNCVVTIKYEDGSLCTLTYTGQGHKDYGKELCEIFVGGSVIKIDDYKALTGYGVKLNEVKSAVSEKGQFEELQAFYDSIKTGDGYPIPLWQMEQATAISLIVDGE
ncbi:MAG: Gfo/Idh/MocA family oxidoreductase [Pseudobutyrivibrio sp.]|nr:Gfo/Idh/MocA family oxidoreductase [Pseudobutyrivibrio sp.]